MTAEPDGPRSRRRRALWAAAIGCTLLIAGGLFSGRVLTFLGQQLIHSDPLEDADAIVVLAPLWDRIIEGADLYRRGYAPVVILTRESRSPAEQRLIDRGIVRRGEDERREALVALGVPSPAITILDPLVGSTVDEARAVADWARHRGVRRIIVVTSPTHTARSRLTFMRALEPLGVTVLVRPSSVTRFPANEWWRSRNTLRDVLLEWQKLVYYRLIELPRISSRS